MAAGSKIQTILCPTDFSELSTYALEHARELASSCGARLLVMHADLFLPPPYFTAFQMEELNEALSRSREGADLHLGDYVKKHVGETGPKVECEVIEAPPIPAILESAEKNNVDLIVMGTHGRSGLSRVMLGSVTERILRETNWPVMTVRRKQGAGYHPFAVRQILCPVNFTEVARQALDYAVHLADCFVAQLTVLSVEESGMGTVEEQMESFCDAVPEDLRSKCSMKQLMRKGNAAEEIVGEAKALGSDLIVLGAQHKRFADSTVIGTTSVRVTRHAPCPVLTLIRR
jgi:nucleotide-binding universal stress UspA family protein